MLAMKSLLLISLLTKHQLKKATPYVITKK
ncbi:hypothetical protein FLCU109888_09035 [Flavobacterium cucumis]|uniref:Uncharacterized protein n=1 Tax=Flavobacterium cucumis TaxID=416016 RepID=A0A1M7ZX84_9FLAO|nr:hypothetical protein SAMN05443547_1784 [Flavobacterium cucumis]